MAPSGPFDRALVLRGMAFLATRYRVEFDSGLFHRHEMFAGTDQRRREELLRAITDPGVAAVVAARGGYGITRILSSLDLDCLCAAPRWIVGFSDLTAFHVESWRLGIASMHAANVTGLGRGDAKARQEWMTALEAPRALRTYAGLRSWGEGRAEGPIVGGNLTMLFTCAAAGRLHIPRGSVLLLEDVAEHSYRIDRMLTALVTGGYLSEVAAVVVGEFTDCAPGRYGVTVESVLRSQLAQLRVPVVAGFPAGHGLHNTPVPLGLRVRVSTTPGEVVINPGGAGHQPR